MSPADLLISHAAAVDDDGDGGGGAADADRVRVFGVLSGRHRRLSGDVAEQTALRHVAHHDRQLSLAHPHRSQSRRRTARPRTMPLSLPGSHSYALSYSSSSSCCLPTCRKDALF